MMTKNSIKVVMTKMAEYASSRARELRRLATTDMTIDSVEVNVAGQKISFKANVERVAAWKLYVELYTRVATQDLKENEGFVREAMNSLHDVFKISRDILKEAGPGVAQGQESLGFYAMAILNMELRPFLAKWHPLLSDWESKMPQEKSRIEHERNWEMSAVFRRELKDVQMVLIKYCDALRKIAGI